MKKNMIFLGAALFLTAFLTSCGNLGYSLVLWNNTEKNLQEGQIVKVFVKSNISHTYIIGIPETKQKVEIPIWQISEPGSKGKAKKLSARYAEFAHTYASVKLDGLPIRAQAVNTAKQVYRLRKDEVIRVLYKGKGQAVTNGKGDLKGEWLRVLTGSGTQGWCFSYNLNLFERTGSDLSVKVAQEEKKNDETLEMILSKKWVPEEYSKMIATGRYNLSRMNEAFGLDFGSGEGEKDENAENVENTEKNVKIVRLYTANTDRNWVYTSIVKNNESYQFEGAQLSVTLRGDTLAAVYTDSNGKTKNENFIAFEGDVSEIIEGEKQRRHAEIESIVKAGPVYTSSNYGTIRFQENETATWRNFNLLIPAIVSNTARGNIDVSVELYLAPSLKKDFDGILTFRFEGMENPVNFFYKKESGGLRLEDAAKVPVKDNLVTGRASSPLVMYFSK